MHTLRVEVDRVEGACTGPMPMTPGKHFYIRGGRVHLPAGEPVCLFALQSILPLLPAKERLTDGDTGADWISRVHRVQCPDPEGRTIWRIVQVPDDLPLDPPGRLPEERAGDLRVTVRRIEGRCVEGTCVGDRALARGSSLYLAQPFCLYALAAILPLLPAKDRAHDAADWMSRPISAICPDPLGNVHLLLEKVH